MVGALQVSAGRRDHAHEPERRAGAHAGEGHLRGRPQHPGRAPDPAGGGRSALRPRAHRRPGAERRTAMREGEPAKRARATARAAGGGRRGDPAHGAPAIRPASRTAASMRAYNFSPGPAVLPLEVLEQARDELLDWNGSGMSVMEVSHRGKAFMQVAAEAEADLRELLADSAQLQGSVPAGRRLRAIRPRAPEPDAGPIRWPTTSTPGTGRRRRSPRRGATARCTSPRDAGGEYCACRRSASSSSAPGRPMCTTRRTRPSAAWSFTTCRRVGGVPLVADMSSNILSRPDRCVAIRADLCRARRRTSGRRG